MKRVFFFLLLIGLSIGIYAQSDQKAEDSKKTMLESKAVILAAIIGGLIAFGGIFVSGYFARKTQKEADEREKRQWHREKLMECYSGAIYYLIKLGISSLSKSAEEDKDTRQHYSEAQRFLNLLRIYHHEPEAIKELEGCSKKLLSVWNTTKELSKAADIILERVKSIAKNDPAINIVM